MIDPPDEVVREFLAYEDDLRAYARRIATDAATGDDLVQEAFLTAASNPPKHSDDLQAWLRAVIRGLAMREVRSRTRRRHWESKASAKKHERIEDPHQNLSEVELVAHRAVECLGDPYSEVLNLRLFEELAPEEIAKRLDRPLETTRSQIYRGLERLRESLRREHGEDFAGVAFALLLGFRFGVEKLASAASSEELETGSRGKIQTLRTRVGVLLLAIVASSLLGLWLFGGEEPNDEVAAGPPLPTPEESAIGALDPGPVARLPVDSPKESEQEPAPVPDPESELVELELLLRDAARRPLAGGKIYATLAREDPFALDAEWIELGESSDEGTLSYSFGPKNCVSPFYDLPPISQLIDEPYVGLYATLDGRTSEVIWVSAKLLDKVPALTPITFDTSAPGLEVTVTNESDEPIKGAEVHLYSIGTSFATRTGSYIRSQQSMHRVTEADGVAYFPSVPSGYRIVAAHPGMGRYVERLSQLSADGEKRRVKLSPGANLHGTIQRKRQPGDALASVTVYTPDIGIVSVTRCDKNGAFAFEGLPTNEPLNVSIRQGTAEGHISCHAILEFMPHENREWNPVLAEPRTVDLRFWNANETPAANENFVLVMRLGLWTGEIHTDAEGRFRGKFDIDPNGEVLLYRGGPNGQHVGHVERSFQGIDLISGSLDIVLPSPGYRLRCAGVQVDGELVPAFALAMVNVATEQTQSFVINSEGRTDHRVPSKTYEAALLTSMGIHKLGLVTVPDEENFEIPTPSVRSGDLEITIPEGSRVLVEVRAAELLQGPPLRRFQESARVSLLPGDYELREIWEGSVRKSTRTVSELGVETVVIEKEE